MQKYKKSCIFTCNRRDWSLIYFQSVITIETATRTIFKDGEKKRNKK